MLYQRYFLRMNQTNMTHLLGLLLAVAVGLTTVQISTLIMAQNFIGGLFSFTEATYFETQYEYVYKNKLSKYKKLLSNNATIWLYMKEEKSYHFNLVVKFTPYIIKILKSVA